MQFKSLNIEKIALFCYNRIDFKGGRIFIYGEKRTNN